MKLAASPPQLGATEWRFLNVGYFPAMGRLNVHGVGIMFRDNRDYSCFEVGGEV